MMDTKLVIYLVKTQTTATSTSPLISKYVPHTNMPIKLNIYALCAQYFMCIFGDVCAYVPHMKNVY